MAIADVIKQKSYERIEYVLHRHAFTFIPIIILFIVLASIPVLVYLLINNLFPDAINGPVGYPLFVLLGSIYYLSMYLFFYAQFVEFYLDLWIVTNDRIVDIEQLGLFSRTITELDLFRIQDVTTDVKGLFPTIFHYGNVIIKTASSNTHIVFSNVPSPNHVREKLIQLSHEDRKFHTGGLD
ncbi:MAG: PH domain-containing protein [Candidatus Magasanikbacteria bacterium]